MPLSLSVLASQLADNCVVETVVEMSAPFHRERPAAPGRRCVADADDRHAAGIGLATAKPHTVGGMHTEIISLANRQAQSGRRDVGDGRIVVGFCVAESVACRRAWCQFCRSSTGCHSRCPFRCPSWPRALVVEVVVDVSVDAVPSRTTGGALGGVVSLLFTTTSRWSSPPGR